MYSKLVKLYKNISNKLESSWIIVISRFYYKFYISVIKKHRLDKLMTLTYRLDIIWTDFFRGGS